MIVSHEHKFIFVHVPRTGGTSIEKSLCTYMGIENWPAFVGEPPKLLESGGSDVRDPAAPPVRRKGGGYKHITAAQLEDYVGEDIWSDYFKFAFVRNPFDHTLSTYLKKIKDKKLLSGLEFSRSKFAFNMALFAKYKVLGAKSATQSDYIMRGDKLLVDFVGRFENLSEDFARVANQLGFNAQLLNNKDATSHTHYRDYYSSTSRNIVEIAKKRDLTNFSYEF